MTRRCRMRDEDGDVPPVPSVHRVGCLDVHRAGEREQPLPVLLEAVEDHGRSTLRVLEDALENVHALVVVVRDVGLVGFLSTDQAGVIHEPARDLRELVRLRGCVLHTGEGLPDVDDELLVHPIVGRPGLPWQVEAVVDVVPQRVADVRLVDRQAHVPDPVVDDALAAWPEGPRGDDPCG